MKKTFKIKSKPKPSNVKAHPSKGVLKKGILPGPTLCMENFMSTTRTPVFTSDPISDGNLSQGISKSSFFPANKTSNAALTLNKIKLNKMQLEVGSL